MKHLPARLKLLFQGKFWAFWHYGELGFTQLTFNGIPILQRDDCPKDTIYFTNITEEELNIKSLDLRTIEIKETVSFTKMGAYIKNNPRRFGKIKEVKTKK